METLRYAPLIRVSTEKQKKKGESLTTQLTQIRNYVELLKGVIPEHCLIYQGQEHSTPQAERKLLEKLLSDSSKGLFDAVIVTDASRWSRDNLRSEAGLNILAENGIKFYVGLMEYDLDNPEHRFILGMSTSINQLQATKQSMNSINNRIERAKRNINSAGLLPYGRTFDKKTGKWDIDPIKKRLIEQAAHRYLNGEGIPAIASTMNMNAANLHRILTQKCGTIKTTNFKYKKINETIEFTIPELLDEKTRNAIKNKIYANTTTRGKIHNNYLLVGYLFCSECGLRLRSRTNEKGRTYYLHSKNGKVRCFNKSLIASEIENSVLIQLVQTFGDPEKIESAIQRAMPNTKEHDELEKEQKELNKSLSNILNEKDRLIEDSNPSNPDALFTRDEIKTKMIKLRERQTPIEERLKVITTKLENRIDKKDIKKRSFQAGAVLSDALKRNPKLIFKRSYDWKRKLIEKAFSGKDGNGQQLGIYITFVDNEFKFEIRGLIEPTVLSLPLTDDYLIDAFHIDAEYQDIPQELQNIRSMLSNIQSKYIVDLIYSITGTV